jgi:hypothetical protein
MSLLHEFVSSCQFIEVFAIQSRFVEAWVWKLKAGVLVVTRLLFFVAFG